MTTAILDRPKARRAPARITPGAEPWVPPLDNGYRLSQPEFHRRYELMPKVKRAELIEGVVFMGSPLSCHHAKATKMILTWLGHYEADTPGVESLDNASLILDPDNEYQPDCLLRMAKSERGQSWIEGDYLHGAPELVVEVALTSVTQDLGNKFKVYRRHGVREYLVWQLGEQRFDWFVWEDAEYIPLVPGAHGTLRSRVFPGLWLDTQALLAGELKAVLKHLQKGLASAEHREFLKRLSAK